MQRKTSRLGGAHAWRLGLFKAKPATHGAPPPPPPPLWGEGVVPPKGEVPPRGEGKLHSGVVFAEFILFLCTQLHFFLSLRRLSLTISPVKSRTHSKETHEWRLREGYQHAPQDCTSCNSSTNLRTTFANKQICTSLKHCLLVYSHQGVGVVLM